MTDNILPKHIRILKTPYSFQDIYITNIYHTTSLILINQGSDRCVIHIYWSWVQSLKDGMISVRFQGTTFNITVIQVYAPPTNPKKLKFNGSAAAAKSHQSCPTLCDSQTAAHQAPLSLGFSRQEYWGWLPFPSSEWLYDDLKDLLEVTCKKRCPFHYFQGTGRQKQEVKRYLE